MQIHEPRGRQREDDGGGARAPAVAAEQEQEAVRRLPQPSVLQAALLKQLKLAS